MKKSQPAGRQGFTLIELLVVIGIIGLLIAVAIPNFLAARQRASDSKMKSDMSQLKSALRLYYNDYNMYPPGGSGGSYVAGSGIDMYGCGTNGLQTCKTPSNPCGTAFASGPAATPCDTVYMKVLPTGFLTPNFTYFQSGLLGDDFCMKQSLGNSSDPDISSSQTRCASACGVNCTGGNKYCECAN